jgi:hypothetical protein
VIAPFPGTAILTTAVPVGLEHQAYHLFTVTAHTDGTHLGVPAKVLEMPVRADAADWRAHEFSPDVILASATPSVAALQRITKFARGVEEFHTNGRAMKRRAAQSLNVEEVDDPQSFFSRAAFP